MQLKKNFVTLLAGILLLCCGMFMACENPSNVANENENQNEPEGIVLTWGNVSSDVKSVRIDTMIGDWSYTAFQINDLTKYKSVTDKYVTKGKDYKYRIVLLDGNGNWIRSDGWFTENAKGGSGELDFSATATSTGIKLSSTADVLLNKIDDMYIDKFKKGSEHVERIVVYESESDNSFIDTFVDPSSEYEYRFRIGFGHNSYTNNKGEKVSATPLVEYPRFKVANVKATAGSGRIRADVLPKAEYDSNKKTITVTQLPQFSVTPKSWNMYINYYKQNNGTWTFASFASEDKGEKLTKEINKNIPAGLWNFEECWFNLYFDNYEYSLGLYDLADVPESIALNVNVENLFIPTLTAKDEGIEISWDKTKLPADTKKLEIQSGNNFFEIYDVNLTSIVYKYVEAGKTYDFYITARDGNGNNLKQSETARVKATGGKGKLKIKNKISITYDEKKDIVTFSELPELTDSPAEWNMNFNYNGSNDAYMTLFGINSKNNQLTYSLSRIPNGEWTFDGYWLNDNHGNSYRYCQYEESLDAFTAFPETIKLSDTYRPTLKASLVDDGIKFEWKNIPENTTDWYVRLYKKNGQSPTDLNISSTSVTSIIDKYVDANTEYRCYVGWKNEDGTWGYSGDIFVTPTKGLGEVKMTNKPAATFDSENNKVIFTTLPKISCSEDWGCGFGYRPKQTGDWNRLYSSVFKDSSNTTFEMRDDINSGEWTLCNYFVWYECEDFEYQHFEYDDLSMLSDIPQSFNFNVE